MPSKPDPTENSGVTRQLIAGDHLAVRDGLLVLLSRPPLRDLPDDQRSTAQLVLAEVLNNVVEHAFAACSGVIEISLQAVPGGVCCLVVDGGAALPDGLPPGTLPDGMGGALDDLPEGGFGWHLIRTLTADLSYQRQRGRNHISFTIRTDTPFA
jgi:serine/threonine-protein kinase RsbW